MSRPGTKSNVLKKSLWKTTLIENRSSRKSNWPQRTKIMTAFPIFNWSWAKRWKGSIACTKPINATSWIKKRISRQNWMLKPLNSAFFYFGLMTQVFWNCFPKWKSPSFPIKWWWFFSCARYMHAFNFPRPGSFQRTTLYELMKHFCFSIQN